MRYVPSLNMLSTDSITAIIAFCCLFLLFWTRRLPSVQAFSDFMTSLNTRGGNIFVLMCSSLYFFIATMKMFYRLLDMVQLGTLKPDNAYALMALQFLTTTAFGGSCGALLKTMTGESQSVPAVGTTSTTKITTSSSSDLTSKDKDAPNT